MIGMRVILENKEYELPNERYERERPILTYLKKGLEHIFLPVTENYPSNKLDIIWNEDKRKLKFESYPLSELKVWEILNLELNFEFN